MAGWLPCRIVTQVLWHTASQNCALFLVLLSVGVFQYWNQTCPAAAISKLFETRAKKWNDIVRRATTCKERHTWQLKFTQKLTTMRLDSTSHDDSTCFYCKVERVHAMKLVRICQTWPAGAKGPGGRVTNTAPRVFGPSGINDCSECIFY